MPNNYSVFFCLWVQNWRHSSDYDGSFVIPYVFLKFVFWQLWPVGCAGCTVFGCLWQTSLCWNFGQQFFRGPRYIVNPQLPAVGRTSKKHTVDKRFPIEEFLLLLKVDQTCKPLLRLGITLKRKKSREIFVYFFVSKRILMALETKNQSYETFFFINA